MSDQLTEQRLKSLLKDGKPLESNATWLDVLYLWAKWTLGRILVLFQIPGLIKPIEQYDQLTGTYIKVQLVEFYVIVSINGNDFYFNRFTGKYSGSGKGV